MNRGLDALLTPRSLAVVGASPQEGKIGNVVLRQLLKGSFRVYPVNPREHQICGLPTYRSVLDLPEPPDLAVLAVPAEATVAAARDCVKRGAGAIIAIAGGFSEAGEAGRELERELALAVRGSRTRVLGPNTMGVLTRRLDWARYSSPPSGSAGRRRDRLPSSPRAARRCWARSTRDTHPGGSPSTG